MNFSKLENACKQANITEVEIYKVRTDGSSVSTFNGDVDKNTVYTTDETYVRGVYDGHLASVYVENDSDDEIPAIVRSIIDNASVTESDDPYFIYGGDDSYASLPSEHHDFDEYTQADRIALCRKIEKTLRDSCEFVTITESEIAVEQSVLTIQNSNGLSVSRSDVDAMMYGSAVIAKDSDTKNGYYYTPVKNIKDFDFSKLVERAVNRTLSSIGAESVPSGNYPVVFENECFRSLVSCFLSMFSGDAVTKKVCLLDGKLGQKVFGDNITITDEPLLEGAYRNYSFDDEGVATKNTVLVENGVLKTYLHNLKTAKMLDSESTGNGFKGGDGNISVMPTNLVLKNDDISFDDMIKDIEDGIFVTSMMGQHAGVNAVSGAFNLQSSGYRIRNGKIAEPVTLIVVSGNIIDLLNNVVAISNDVNKLSRIATGSARIKGLNVSGR